MQNKIRFHVTAKLCITLLAVTYFSTISAAQILTQTIRGIVKDADSKSPLEMVGIKVLNTDSNIISTTDAEGKFRLLRVSVGRHSIKFSFIGYEDVTLQNIMVTSGKETILNVEMHENVAQINEVEIIFRKDKSKANNELVTNSARNFQSEETERYAGSRGDPSRMVANYAGVVSGNDTRNDIIVRGNSPLGVLWRLENTDIPNPNHFSTQGSTGGPISMLNNNILGTSDFLTGAFPAEYGNKMAAVFDLKLRNGNNEKTEYTGQFGMNGLEAGIEGPISKANGSSFLINYRYSTLKLFQVLGIRFGVSGIPTYQDGTFKLNFPTGKAGIFTLWGMGGMSTIALLDSQKDSTDWSFTKSGEDLRFNSKMGVVGFSHLYFFNEKVSGKLNLSISGTGLGILIDTISKGTNKFQVYKNQSNDGQYFANYTLTDKINARHLIKTGFTWKNNFFDYQTTYWSRINMQYQDQYKDKNNASSLQAFIHWQYRITDNLTLNNGVHLNTFLLNNSYAIEPRSGIRWQFSQKQTLSASYGMHSQTLPMVYYFYRAYDANANSYVQTNKTLSLSKSMHYVLGYDYNFAKDFRFKIETYYQDLYNIPIQQYHSSSYSAINLGTELSGLRLVDSLYNKGTGYNYGAEFTLEKFFSKNFYFLNSLSLYQSKYCGSDGILRYSAFSGNYIYNFLGGVEIPIGEKKHTLGIDIKFSVAGGNRYTPIDIEKSIEQRNTVYIDSLAYSKQFSPYQKLDFKISYRINRKKIMHYFFISIENILNHKNILQQVYDSSTQGVIEQYQLGLFPYGGYRIEF